MKTYYDVFKIDKFRVNREELTEWKAKCSEFFTVVKWSIHDYSEYLLIIGGIHIIFEEYEPAQKIIKNLANMLKAAQSKAITIYKPKDRDLISYYFMKAQYYKGKVAYKTKNFSVALKSVMKAYSHGDIFKLNLRKKCLELLKSIFNEDKRYREGPILNNFILFYQKQLSNNFVIVIDASDALMTTASTVQGLANSVLSRISPADRFSLIAYNNTLVDQLTRDCVTYKDNDIKQEACKDLRNFTNKLSRKCNTKSRNIYSCLDRILDSLSYKEFNNYMFLFVLGPNQKPQLNAMDNPTDLNLQLSPTNFNLSKLNQDIAEKRFLHTMLICNNTEEHKEERILQIISANKRNHTIELERYMNRVGGMRQMVNIIDQFII